MFADEACSEALGFRSLSAEFESKSHEDTLNHRRIMRYESTLGVNVDGRISQTKEISGNIRNQTGCSPDNAEEAPSSMV